MGRLLLVLLLLVLVLLLLVLVLVLVVFLLLLLLLVHLFPLLSIRLLRSAMQVLRCQQSLLKVLFVLLDALELLHKPLQLGLGVAKLLLVTPVLSLDLV